MINPSFSFVLILVILSAFGVAQAEPGEPEETPLTTVRIASGFDRPLYVTHAPADFTRIFVVEKSRRIWILKDGELLAEPFLDLTSIARVGWETGLLGLAFHPDYAKNGFLYVNYTDLDYDTVVARYQVSEDPDVVDPESARIVLRIVQPTVIHNGGWMEFGQDGHLYIATGDGGGANDPGNRAQTVENNLLGKILRIDINGDDFPDDPERNYAIPPDNPFVGEAGDDEIWAYGLRNPWRNAFDKETGDLYITDVGQGDWEEINFQRATSDGGENYGWRCMEGLECRDPLDGQCDCDDPSFTPPVHVYGHTQNRCSITGGEVYRGCAIPDLNGAYFFGDFCTSEIWSFRFVGGVNDFRDRTTELDPGGELTIGNISSFGRDAFGEMYICDHQFGQVFKIVPAKPLPPPALTESMPPDGAIDAGQPFDPDGANPSGPRFVDFTFDRCAAGFVPDDFAVSDTSNPPDPPQVERVFPVAANTLRIFLDRPMAEGEWTTIHRLDGPESVTIGRLPGDVDQSGEVSEFDVSEMVVVLRDDPESKPLWSADVDRSGRVAPADLPRLIDLINGGDAFPKYLKEALP